MNYLAVIDHRIDGIPAKIGVVSYTRVPPWRGDASRCPSDMDYHGYTSTDWEILDTTGRPAAWLDTKRTPDIDLEIEQAIDEHFKRDDE